MSASSLCRFYFILLSYAGFALRSYPDGSFTIPRWLCNYRLSKFNSSEAEDQVTFDRQLVDNIDCQRHILGVRTDDVSFFEVRRDTCTASVNLRACVLGVVSPRWHKRHRHAAAAFSLPDTMHSRCYITPLQLPLPAAIRADSSQGVTSAYYCSILRVAVLFYPVNYIFRMTYVNTISIRRLRRRSCRATSGRRRSNAGQAPT